MKEMLEVLGKMSGKQFFSDKSDFGKAVYALWTIEPEKRAMSIKELLGFYQYEEPMRDKDLDARCVHGFKVLNGDISCRGNDLEKIMIELLQIISVEMLDVVIDFIQMRYINYYQGLNVRYGLFTLFEDFEAAMPNCLHPIWGEFAFQGGDVSVVDPLPKEAEYWSARKKLTWFFIEYEKVDDLEVVPVSLDVFLFQGFSSASAKKFNLSA